MASLATAQRLSDAESGRFGRVSARLAVSCLLFFRGALPQASFRVGVVSGVEVPVLDRREKAGRFLIELLEHSVMPAVRAGRVAKLELCIYAADDTGCDTAACPDGSEGEGEGEGTVEDAGQRWKIVECYVIDTQPARAALSQADVPALVFQLKEDIKTSALALSPLPAGSVLGVGLRVEDAHGPSAAEAAAAGEEAAASALPGFNTKQAFLPSQADRLVRIAKRSETSCEISLDLSQTMLQG